jgi:hypothetical protein
MLNDKLKFVEQSTMKNASLQFFAKVKKTSDYY